MSFARLHKIVSYVLSGLGLFALSLGPELELPAELLMFAAWIASWFAEGERIQRPGWARAWTIALGSRSAAGSWVRRCCRWCWR